MKKFIIMICCLALEMQAFEYAHQFDPNQECIAKAKISSNNKTKIGTNEIAIDIKVNCPASTEFSDFVNSLPIAGNYSSTFEEWKLSFVDSMTQLINLIESEKIFNSFWSVRTGGGFSQETNSQAKKDTYDISINIRIECPRSAEFVSFLNSIPPSGNYFTDFKEWKASFKNNMTQLIQLVESEKVFNSSWTVKTEGGCSGETEEN